MTLADIKNQEQRTSEAELFKIYIFKEGDWWRIYEWSLYLYDALAQANLVEKLNFTHKPTHIYSGMPLASSEKYLKGIDMVNVDNERYVIDTSALIKLSNITLGNYMVLLDDFKKQIPIIDSKKKNNPNKTITKIDNSIPFVDSPKNDLMQPLVNALPLGLSVVLHSILTYPLINKTPYDNMKFIEDTQKELSKFLHI